jgi:hypothetical protein
MVLEAMSSGTHRTLPSDAPFSPDANAVGLWHFDQGEGQVAPDVSSSGNDGTLGDTGDVDSVDPTWVDGYPW